MVRLDLSEDLQFGVLLHEAVQQALPHPASQEVGQGDHHHCSGNVQRNGYGEGEEDAAGHVEDAAVDEDAEALEGKEEQKEEGGQGRALRGIAQDAVHCEALPAAEAEEQDARPEAEQGDLGSPVLEEALLPAGLLGALSSSAGGHALRPPLQRRSASGFQQAA